MTCYIPRWFSCPQTVTHPSSNRAQCRLTTLIEANALTTTLRHHPNCYYPNLWQGPALWSPFVRGKIPLPFFTVCQLKWSSLCQNLTQTLQFCSVVIFSARQHICYSALFANARPSVCPSVCPAVCHTGGSVKDGYS